MDESSCGEGIASHTGPESCGGSRKVAGEALTGPEEPILETALNLGCAVAAGLSGNMAVLNAIWPAFVINAVFTAEGTRMTYWGGKTNNLQNLPEYFTAEGLAKNADGRCQARSSLMVETLAAQGIQSAITGLQRGFGPLSLNPGAPLPVKTNKFTVNALGQNDQGGATFKKYDFPNHAVVQLAGNDAAVLATATNPVGAYAIYDPS